MGGNDGSFGQGTVPTLSDRVLKSPSDPRPHCHKDPLSDNMSKQ